MLRRLLLLMLLVATTFSTGCVAAIPLALLVVRNRVAVVEPPAGTDFDAVRLVSHVEVATPTPAESLRLAQPEFIQR